MADLSREESKRLRAALAEEADHPRRMACGCRVRAQPLPRARSRCRAWADALPENRLHGVIAGKLYTYARGARVRRWSNGIEITGKRNTSMTNTPVSAALGLIRYAKRIDDPVGATTAVELATARLDRDDLESVLRLIWPSMAEMDAGFHLSPAPRQAARDDTAFAELIAQLDDEDDDPIGPVWRGLPDDDSDG